MSYLETEIERLGEKIDSLQEDIKKIRFEISQQKELIETLIKKVEDLN